MRANRIRKLLSVLSHIILLFTVSTSDYVLTLLCCADMIPCVLAGEARSGIREEEAQ
jgi:hypothetical protein